MRGFLGMLSHRSSRRQAAADARLQESLAQAEQESEHAYRALHRRMNEVGISAMPPVPPSDEPLVDDRVHDSVHRIAVVAARSSQMNELRLLRTRHEHWSSLAAEVRELRVPQRQVLECSVFDPTLVALWSTDEVDRAWRKQGH